MQVDSTLRQCYEIENRATDMKEAGREEIGTVRCLAGS